MEDDPRPERPVTVTTQETIDEIHEMIMTGRWWITQRFGTTKDQRIIWTFLRHILHTISPEIGNHRWDLDPSIPTRVEGTIKTTKNQSLASKKARLVRTPYLGFFAMQRECCWWWTTYTDLLRQLWKKIKKIWHGKLTRGEYFHQDKAPPYKSTVAAIQECRFELLQHSPYSPDLALSHYIFPLHWLAILKWWCYCWRHQKPSSTKKIWSVTTGLSV